VRCGDARIVQRDSAERNESALAPEHNRNETRTLRSRKRGQGWKSAATIGRHRNPSPETLKESSSFERAPSVLR